MSWEPGIYTGIAAVAATTFAALAVAGWRRERASATAFGCLATAGLLWAASYGIQLGFTTRAEQLVWQAASLAASATVPPLLLVFVLRYAGEWDRLSRRALVLLAAEAVAFAALTMTNDLHHLVWTDATLHPPSVSPALDLTFGTGYYVHVAIAYAEVAAALLVLLSVFFRSVSLYRRQSGLLILGAMPPFLSHVAYTLKLSPIPGLDLTPFTFTVTGVLYGLALFHFDLLDRTPVAHQRALELMGDGLLVVDVDGLVVDSNEVARAVYDVDGGEPSFGGTTGRDDPEALDGVTTTAVVDGSHRVFDHHVSRLHDDQGAFTGYAVVLRDVTDRNAYEQRLEVANRVLRHNLRNDMNVILGYADLLEDLATTSEQARMADTISETATDLISLSEKLRQTIDLEQQRSDPVDVDAVAMVERLVAEFREDHPEVAFKVDVPDAVRVAAVTERALTLAVRNLVENAVEHNDPAGLTVEVAIRVEGESALLTVSDDGSGMPPMERDVLASGTETPLQHSSGLGLWLIYWVVNASGGDVSVTADDSGTTVTLELQRADSRSPAPEQEATRGAVG